MRSEDSDAFRVVIEDLCVAYNRPCSDAVVRVFWESLKWAHIHDVRRMAVKHRNTAKKFPTPRELAPERSAAPAKPPEPEVVMSPWAIAANKILLQLAYQDKRRGFKPLKEKLAMLLAMKADYVRMAESAEAGGEPWDGKEFRDLVYDGFEAVIL